jgi:Mn-dependent DtxR family transcriptional regulator
MLNTTCLTNQNAFNMSAKTSLKDTILKEFLKDTSLGPSEMSSKLGAKYNSVKAAFAKLNKEGLLLRPNRGSYEPNVAGLLLLLMDRLEALERTIK